MSFPRTSGILLHPTSLPSRYGVGDLGEAAYRFVDFLAAAGQHLWQVLPLGPTGYADSPYQCFSAFAGNPLLVNPERLVGDGLLSTADLADVPDFPADSVDYGRAIDLKYRLLRRAFSNFKGGARAGLRDEFESFTAGAAEWLDDYALYRAMKEARGGAPWYEWEPEAIRREPQSIDSARHAQAEQVEAQKFYQFLFFRQWAALRAYCHEKDVRIVGDIPIFVAHDSSDVWAQPHLFKLDPETGRPHVVAGVPPDYFSKTGQLWGNPIYNWGLMVEDNFRWWVARVRSMLSLVDVIRIDHFRGFAAYWEVPGGDQTAERGRWVFAPGRELFHAIKHELGTLPIIAEDLGFITPDVIELRDEFDFPGMRILQFGFSTDTTNKDLPHNYVRNAVVYTGTHDNDTAVGWFNSDPTASTSVRSAAQVEREKQFCLNYLQSDGREIHWDFVRAVMASAADTALIPLQDVLGLGSDARMNTPATMSGNWAWRFPASALTDEHAARLRHYAELYGRHPAITDRPEHTAESYEAKQTWG
jgi:4-alpha-glucanotransferase